MCGISGIIQRGAPPDVAALQRMVSALHHRGPDASGHCILDNVGLGHNRLALVGLGECGAQPMLHPDDHWAITYNGEIFNHVELRRTGAYRGSSDTETLLHALADHGTAATLPTLNGFFAFAALDRRTQTLHLVRDPFGVKPLYYAQHGDRFYFASEARAILAADFPTRQPEIEVLRHHIVHRWCHGSATPFTGISKLLPGQRLEVDINSLAVTPIAWNSPADWVDPARAEELASLSADTLVELVEDHVRVAVQRRLLADVPVATLCSGGIDSSLVTAIAANQREGLQAFVIQPLDDPDSDESPYAQAVCDRVGATLNRVPFDSASWRAAFLRSIPHFENPLWIEASMGSSVIAEAIRVAGFKAALGGDAADEFFGGYDYRYPDVRQAFADEIGRPNPGSNSDHSLIPTESDLSKALRHPGEPPTTERDYLDALHSSTRAAYAHHHGARRELESLTLAESRMHLAISYDQKDKATMRSSIEYREPFLDADLLRLAANLPLECKLWPEAKGVLRAAARRHLPDTVMTRPKIGFTYNTDRMFEGQVRPSFYAKTMLEELFAVPNKKIAKWFEPGRGRATFRICSAEIWLRHFIGQQETGEIGEDLWVN